MIRTFRALFLARPAREKLLILVLVVAVAAIWLSSLIGRAGAFAAKARGSSAQLKTQALWISRRDRIETYAREEASHLDPSQTLDGLRLNGTVQDLAQAAGLTGYNIAPGQDLSNGNFAFHTVNVSIQRASWDAIENFYHRLQQRAPYIGIESFSLLADRANPALLNASLSVSSVEIVRSAR
ncbi:MAG: hypothetical protein ACREFX_08145 [Opitutaceae bacterium]